MSLFPASPKNDPIELFLVTPDTYSQFDKDQDLFTKRRFEGQAGKIVYITEDDHIRRVYCGLKNEIGNPYAISSLVQKMQDLLPLKDPQEAIFDLKFLPEDWSKDTVYLGWSLAHYRQIHYKKDVQEDFDKFYLVIRDEAAKHRAIAMTDAIALTRNLIQLPANFLGPQELAAEAKKFSKTYKTSISVISGTDLPKHGYPMVLSVGESSHRKPCLIDLQWGKQKHPRVTLVGKGVCFDTGGVNVKPANAMYRMKKDMGGAAHALGLAAMIIAMDLPVCLRVLIPAVDNSISEKSFRQGDVLKTRDGTTIEVGHTDAEGRLILSDALIAASEDHPDLLIDFATLTGAARVALGYEIPALFGTKTETMRDVQDLSMELHDPVWTLPLWHDYLKEMSSDIADIKSIGSGRAGAIYAGLFLKEFVKDDIDWMHFDIYGWANDTIPGRPKGGADFALRTLFSYLEDRYGKA